MPSVPVPTRVLLVECSDRSGLVHAITGVLFRHGVNVVGNQEFVDRPTRRFFMRTEFEGDVDATRITDEVRALLPLEAGVRFSRLEPRRIVVLATHEHHCLADILVRHAFGEIHASILAVVSNRDTLEPLVRRFELPFHHVPHAGLEQGPIVVQQVIPVDHSHAAEDLQQAGRDVEQVVLARALRLVLEDRVFLCGNRTVIFD